MANSMRSNSTTNPRGEIVVDAEAFGGFNKEYYKFMGEEALRSSGITRYVIVRPGALISGEGGETGIKPGDQHLVYGGAGADLGDAASIHRADVAAVVCKA